MCSSPESRNVLRRDRSRRRHEAALGERELRRRADPDTKDRELATKRGRLEIQHEERERVAEWERGSQQLPMEEGGSRYEG